MSSGRNEPCPCGSGKKYKKCCGTPRVAPDPVTLNRKAAYAGETGRRRRQFCIDYTAYKKTGLAQAETMLKERAAAEGATLSCKKGCSYCCRVYVFATLQEAECISHYLYEHEDALNRFLEAYRGWRRGLGLFERKLARLGQALARSLAGELSGGEQARFQADIIEYAMRKVPCPFLAENACSIYEVRPFVCAAVAASTPPDWCSVDSESVGRAKHFKLEFNLENEMPYFMPTRSPIVFGCMPELVHNILSGGYCFLADVAGLGEQQRLKDFCLPE